jgi:hypothetical protein
VGPDTEKFSGEIALSKLKYPIAKVAQKPNGSQELMNQNKNGGVHKQRPF